MTAYLLKRLAIAVATLVLASMVVFAVLEILPGDPARLMLGMNASADQVELLRNQMGLNAPLGLALSALGRRPAQPRFRPLLHLFGAGHRPRARARSSSRCRWR